MPWLGGKSINMDGAQQGSPLRVPFHLSLTMAAKPRQIMPLGRRHCYKRQVLCRHHSKLGLFSPNSSNAPFMHSKTPSAPVLPGAITADQKNHDNSCCQTKAKQRGQEKVRDKFDAENYSLERAVENTGFLK